MPFDFDIFWPSPSRTRPWRCSHSCWCLTSKGLARMASKLAMVPESAKKWLPRVSVTPRSPTMRVLIPIAMDSMAAVDETVMAQPHWRSSRVAGLKLSFRFG